MFENPEFYQEVVVHLQPKICGKFIALQAKGLLFRRTRLEGCLVYIISYFSSQFISVK